MKTQDEAEGKRVRSSHPGRSWRISGIALMFVGMAGVIVLQGQQANADSASWTAIAFLATSAILATSGGFYSFVRGKKRAALSARELTARDKRIPVIYLRSFKDDAAGATNPLSGWFGLISFIFGLQTEEEQLAEGFNDLGPFIAIGKPGERLPQTGAARMYVANAEWQERVEQLMRDSRLVVFRAGKTPGFWWEVQRAVEIAGPSRMVFLVPFTKRKYEQFRRRAETMLPCRLPDLPSGRNVSIGRLRAMIYFGPDWTPRIVRLKNRWSVSVNQLAIIIRKVLEPVALQVGLDMRAHPPCRRSLIRRALLTIPGLLTMVVAFQFAAGIAGGIGIQFLDVYLNNRGLADVYRGNLDRAISTLDKTIDLNP